MKKYLFLWSWMLLSFGMRAQFVESEQCIGGNGNDNVKEVLQTEDGGALVIVHTSSNDRDFPDNHGGQDIGLIKLNAQKEIEWKKCEGSQYDDIYVRCLEFHGHYYIYSYPSDTFSERRFELTVLDHHGARLAQNVDMLYTFLAENLDLTIDTVAQLIYTSYNSYGTLFIHAFDFNGNSIWTHDFDLNGYVPSGWVAFKHKFFCVPIKNKQLFVFAQMSSSGFWPGEFTVKPVMLKIDSTGNEIIRDDSTFNLFYISSVYSGPADIARTYTVDADTLTMLVNYKGFARININDLGMNPAFDSFPNYSFVNTAQPYNSTTLIKQSNLGKLFENGYFLFINAVSDSAGYYTVINFYNYKTGENRLIRTDSSGYYNYLPIGVYYSADDSAIVVSGDNNYMGTSISIIKLKMDGTILYRKNLITADSSIYSYNFGPTYVIENNKWYKNILITDVSTLNSFQLLQVINLDNGNIEFEYRKIFTSYDSSMYDYFAPIPDNRLFAISEFPSHMKCYFGGYDMAFSKMLINTNHIFGAAYIDYNNNNIYNGDDLGYNLGTLKSTKGERTVSTFMFSPYYYGYTENQVDTGAWETTVLLPKDYYTISPPLAHTTHNDYGHSDSFLFALHPKASIRDMSISLINTFVTRPGQTSSYEIVYRNEGTDTAYGTIYMIMDPRLHYFYSYPPADTSGDTLKWGFGYINANAFGKITLFANADVPPLLNAGDTLSLHCWITNADRADTTPQDNYAYLKDLVHGSFDPNDKSCNVGEEITEEQIQQGEYLTYTIRFQNTGNDSALLVSVLDTLDANLDWSTFQVVDASHPFTFKILDDHILQITFKDIGLPPSSINEFASHGFISYKVKPKQSLMGGASVKNTAHIYFDYNVPVSTSTVNTRVTLLTPLPVLQKNNLLKIYPNPNNGQFAIEFTVNEPLQSIFIFDLSGRKVLEEKVAFGKIIPINMQGFAAGLYTIELKTAKEKYIQKILVNE